MKNNFTFWRLYCIIYLEQTNVYKNEKERRISNMAKKNLLDSTCGISDKKMTKIFKKTIKLDEAARALKGLPQARFDVKSGKAYLEYPNGRKEYV